MAEVYAANGNRMDRSDKPPGLTLARAQGYGDDDMTPDPETYNSSVAILWRRTATGGSWCDVKGR